MELDEAIGKALDGDSVLFVGAGFSLGAINIKGEKFLRGSELTALFARRAGLSSITSLEDAAEAYADKYGDDSLISEIQREFTAHKIQTFHQEIAKISWKRIYTTNYDNVVERAYSEERKRITPVTLSMNVLVQREMELATSGVR